MSKLVKNKSVCHSRARRVQREPLRNDQQLRQKDPHTRASILAGRTQTDPRSHMGTSKMLTRQLEVMLVSCGNPGLGPKQPAAHTGQPVWTVCWKRCYQCTARNEGWAAHACVRAYMHAAMKAATGPAGGKWRRGKWTTCPG